MRSLMQKLTGKKVAPLVVLAVGACLFLPLLGSFGLWDPHEVRVADVAKEVAASGSWGMKVSSPRPPLPVWVVVAGFKLFGVGEVGGRLPLALCAILALLVTYYLGEGLSNRRAGLLGALALATMPAFFLGARQLTSSVVPILCTTLAVAGLARAAWPSTEKTAGRRALDLLLGVIGLALGHLAAGTTLGIAVPLSTVALALIIARGPLGAWLAMSGAAVASWSVVFFAYRSATAGSGHGALYSAVLGGIPHASSHATQMVSVLTQLGFGLFPWVILLPLAAARAFATDRDEAPKKSEAAPAPTGGEIGMVAPGQVVTATNTNAAAGAPPEPEQPHAVLTQHQRYGRIVLLLWATIGYLATTLQCATVGEVAFVSVAAVALLAGIFLDEVLDDPRPLALPALVIALGAAILAHDFFLMPEKFAGAHVLEGIKWPGPLLAAPYVILFMGLAWGGVLGLAHIVKHQRRETLVFGAVGVAILTALTTSFWIIPSVSAHLSYKGLFTKYKNLGGSDGELGKYHVPTNLSYALPTGGKAQDITGLPQLFQFLAKPARVFVICSSEDLAQIDQYAKTQPGAADGSPAYLVIDDSNSHVLLLSNKLGGGETDRNPLRRQVVRTLPRQPQHELHADFEGKVELIGYYIIDEHDMEADRSTAPAGSYQIFTGMFLGDKRLKAVTGPNDGENRVKLGVVRVK
jgi:4-amino-4-deoxy-L-arabinose transferase-like glycosyltransferase